MNKQELAKLMSESAQDAVSVSKDQFDLELDFTQGSIAVVDIAINQFLQEYEEQALEDKSIFTLCNIYGAYIGEVFKKHAGGEWVFDKQDPKSASIFISIDENTYAFAGICYEKLVNNNNVSVQAYFEQALAAHQ